MATLRKKLLHTENAEGNTPIQMVERSTFNRVYHVHEKPNRELVAQIGIGFNSFLQTIFPEEYMLVLRELDSTGYYREARTYSAFASTRFKEKFSNILRGEAFASTLSRAPKNRFARRVIEVKGTPFQPSTNPSGISVNNLNKSYK